jgi:hypothetical protein
MSTLTKSQWNNADGTVSQGRPSTKPKTKLVVTESADTSKLVSSTDGQATIDYLKKEIKDKTVQQMALSLLIGLAVGYFVGHSFNKD